MYTGLTGLVKVGGNKVAYISNWSVEDTMDIIEITELGEKSKKKKAGLQSWSASADGAVSFVNDINEATPDAGDYTESSQKKLFEAKHDNEKIGIELYLNDGSNSKDKIYFVGNGYIESLSVDLSAEDKGNISISINGNGELLIYKEEFNGLDTYNKPTFKPAAVLVGDPANLG